MNFKIVRLSNEKGPKMYNEDNPDEEVYLLPK